MAVIILGSNQLEQNVGSNVPIVLPVEQLPIGGVIVLSNPLLLRMSSTSTSSDSFWIRNVDYEYLRPATVSDRVIVGGSTFLTTEQFRVVGSMSASQYFLNLNFILDK